jgi:uncharacterized protein (TIGR02453 family)
MFPGFPPEALTFFRGIARNNDRDWFLPRKEVFDSKVKAPMIALVEAINAEFGKFAPDYIADPKRAVYRIYRDTRFSPDKSPYKTHLAAVFARRGGDRGSAPGFYFAISAQEIGIAGGVYETFAGTPARAANVARGQSCGLSEGGARAGEVDGKAAR